MTPKPIYTDTGVCSGPAGPCVIIFIHLAFPDMRNRSN